jgi:hypothetical protein
VSLCGYASSKNLGILWQDKSLLLVLCRLVVLNNASFRSPGQLLLSRRFLLQGLATTAELRGKLFMLRRVQVL